MKDTIQYSDFEKLDIRVGKIIEAEAPDWSEKLIKLTVDFGEEVGTKTILAGVKTWYSVDDFVGKKYLFVVNLAERQMGKSVSQGMMLVADEEEKPLVLEVCSEAELGALVR